MPLRIEAVALAGRPVYFRIIAPWTRPTESAGVPIATDVAIDHLFPTYSAEKNAELKLWFEY